MRRKLAASLRRPQRREIGTLILIRHGQSIWNGTTATFTGWCDVALTDRGRSQAREAGELLGQKGYGRQITRVFTSELSRAYETADLVMDAVARNGGHDEPEIVRDWRLNERHYGCVQGVCKTDAMLERYFGADAIRDWRRSMHGRPPPLDQSHPHYLPPPAPTTESLADCQKRVLECFEDTLKPALFEGPDRTVLVAAHSNTLRALMAHVDGVPDDDVPSLHVPNSVPILYRFCEETQQLASRALGTGATDSHARWLLSTRNLARLRSSLQSGGVLTRALFDAMDADGDRSLTAAEIDRGLRSLLGDDVVVLAVVKRIVRHLKMKGDDAVCTLADFEASAEKIAHDVFVVSGLLEEARAREREEEAKEHETPWGRIQRAA